jgi:hypothetical protein
MPQTTGLDAQTRRKGALIGLNPKSTQGKESSPMTLFAPFVPARSLRTPVVLVTRWLLALALGIALVACATGPKMVSHGFNFDGWNDGWAKKVDLLAFSYGDQYRETREESKDGKGIGYRSSIFGPMPVGEFLYVKWRLIDSGEVIEKRVELKDRLPADMTGKELTFVIDGRDLYVYVVTAKRKPSYGAPPLSRTWRSNFNETYEIFPGTPAR